MTLWRSVKPQHLERLEILKQLVRALQGQHISHELRQEATQAAHSLTGALGIFGLKSGSDLARSIERLLRSNAPIHRDSQKQLSEMVWALETELNQALRQLDQPRSGSVSPLLVLIDSDVQLLKKLTKAIRAQGFNVKTAMDETALLQLQPSLQPSPKTNESEISASAGVLPDVVLFNFSLADSDKASLEWLSQLINQTPPLLVLVCSADGSLASRIKAAQLGSHSFFHNPDVAAVLKGVLEMRACLQPLSHKVLAVDDDQQVLKALQALLEPKGFQLITLTQPRNFWATLQASSPDLLLLDIEMPKFNGIELCRAVRQAPIWNRLPIVFFTAHSDADTKAAALRAGADDLVEKSLGDSTLLNRLFEQLKQSQLKRAMAAIADTPSPQSTQSTDP